MSFDIQKMMCESVYPHPVTEIKLIETHISWVILTGDFAYKIKKAVNFGFLDFSTLEKRHEWCLQELQLNRRLAADLYQDVVAITGAKDKPEIDHINTAEDVMEYAVKMIQFPQSEQLDNMLEAGELQRKHIDALAVMIANFHQQTHRAGSSMSYGESGTIQQPVEKNFKMIAEYPQSEPCTVLLDELNAWSKAEFIRLKPVFTQRKSDGFIRECHGDMHLGNLLWHDKKPLAFDCIEFNAELRWIDVISEIAFLVMDLQDRQQDQLANNLLNTYLMTTGDYAGLTVMSYYQCYRAMVRAKVNALRLQQDNLDEDEKQQTRNKYESYLKLAKTYTQPSEVSLIIMRGLSASGKSTVSQRLMSKLDAVRIRSDIERKRLFKIPFEKNASNGADQGIYSAQASEQTYAKLLELASDIIQAGYCTVIVDATFLHYKQRKPFQQLAEKQNIPYQILELTAPVEVLRQRIIDRKNDVSDADLKVLEHQLANWQPLRDEEQSAVISEADLSF